MRKVVLATNIAETSLTIEGIRLVVDSAQSARIHRANGPTRWLRAAYQSGAALRSARARRTTGAGEFCLHLLTKEQVERAAAQSAIRKSLHSDLPVCLRR